MNRSISHISRVREKGIALLVVLGILMVVTITLVVMTQRGASLLRVVGIRMAKTRADYVALEGLNRALLKIRTELGKAENETPEMDPNVIFNPSDPGYDPAYTAAGEDYITAKSAYRYFTQDNDGSRYEVRYQIASPISWTYDPVDRVSVRKFILTASVRSDGGKRESRSMLRQEFFVRRETHANYLMFQDQDFVAGWAGTWVTRGNIRTNGNFYFENGRLCNGANGTGTFMGSIFAAGHIVRGPKFMRDDGTACGTDTYPLAFGSPQNPVHPNYPKIKIVDPSDPSRYGYLYAQGTEPAPGTGDEPLPPNAPSDPDRIGSDAIRVLDPVNFRTHHVSDPSKERDPSDPTKPGVTWEVDEKWKLRTNNVFRRLLQDKTQGTVAAKVPSTRYVDPTGTFGSTAHFIVKSEKVEGGTKLLTTLTDSSGTVWVQHYVWQDDVGRLDVTQTDPKFEYAQTSGDLYGVEDGTIVVGSTAAGRLPEVTVNAHVGKEPKVGSPYNGFVPPGHPDCFKAIKQGRIFVAKEDRFMHFTRIDMQLLKNNCPLSTTTDMRIFAYRTDVQEDQTVASSDAIAGPNNPLGLPNSVDENRIFNGFALANADEIPYNSLAFVSPQPVIIEGNFNRHKKASNVSWSIDSDGDKIQDIDDPDAGYDPTATSLDDSWRPVMLAADHFLLLAPDPQLYKKMNRFRFVDGADLEIAAKCSDDVHGTKGPRCPYNTRTTSDPEECQPIDCQVPDAIESAEINALMVGGRTWQVDENRGAGDMTSFQQDNIDPNTGFYMRGSYLGLWRQKYATQYGRPQCNANYDQMFDAAGLCTWSKGDENEVAGKTSGPKFARVLVPFRSHEANLYNGYPISDEFRKLLPGIEAGNKPYEVREWVRLDGDDPLF